MRVNLKNEKSFIFRYRRRAHQKSAVEKADCIRKFCGFTIRENADIILMSLRGRKRDKETERFHCLSMDIRSLAVSDADWNEYRKNQDETVRDIRICLN